MRFSQSPPTLLSLLAVLLSSPHPASTKPYPREQTLVETHNSTIEARQCANPCGWSGQLCCTTGQVCFTDASGQAQCGSSGSGASNFAAQPNNGQWQYYTTTFVRTDLVTVVSTYSSFVGVVTTPVLSSPPTQIAPIATSVSCNYAINQSPCGHICCASGQYCASPGQCAAAGGGSSAYYSSFYSYSAPLRPTTGSIVTVTSTGSITATVPFQTPVGTGGSVVIATPQTSGGLSGGAITGIVIGVIAGILLLLLLCAACCFKGLLDGLLRIFGLGPNRNRRRVREEVYTEQRHSHHGGTAAGGRTWFGAAGSSRPKPAKKTGGFGGAGAVGAALAGLALILGLKRKRNQNEKSSYGSGSSYYSSDYTSSSR